MQQYTEVASGSQEAQAWERLKLMTVRRLPYSISSYGISDIGLVRHNNEDVWGQLPESGFFVLADGMGGHQAGEIAARHAVDILSDLTNKKVSPTSPHSLSSAATFIFNAIKHTNTSVFKLGRSDPNLKGMGTTLCCLLFQPKGVVFAHVGDSRIYLFRQGVLRQLTRDHSLLCELMDQGHMTEQQVSDFLYKNIITKAVGTEPHVTPSVDTMPVEVGDIFMMCSDGLSDLLTSEEITSIMNAHSSIQEAGKAMVLAANEKGGRDNITIVLTKIDLASSK